MNISVHTNSNEELSQLAWQLYESSFPINERRPFRLHIKATLDKRFCPYVYISGQMELLAIYFYWNFLDFRYLEHFAVNPNYRNQGIGSKLIQMLNADKKPIILEIEPPMDKQTKKRLNFYERNHFKHTGYGFKQLKYRQNANDLHLDLLCNKEMDRDLYEQFRKTIYQELSRYNEK